MVSPSYFLQCQTLVHMIEYKSSVFFALCPLLLCYNRTNKSIESTRIKKAKGNECVRGRNV